jgi:MFS family permease
MLAAPPNAQIFADLSPPELRGRYQSVFYPMFPAAGFVAPAAGGWSLQQLGNWHWALCGLAGILVAAGHLLASPARERTPPLVIAATARTMIATTCRKLWSPTGPETTTSRRPVWAARRSPLARPVVLQQS